MSTLIAKFGPDNRITAERLKEACRKKGGHMGLCRDAWGVESSDCQCTGYDYLCALAMLFYGECNQNSYLAIYNAQSEVSASQYSAGFQSGWDEKRSSLKPDLIESSDDFKLGVADAKAVIDSVSKWASTTKHHGQAYRR